MSDVAYTIGVKSGDYEFDFVAWNNRYDGYDIVTSDSLEDYEGWAFIRAEGETDLIVYRYDTEKEARKGLAEAKGTFDNLKLSILKMEEDDGEWWVDSIIEVDDDNL